MRKRPFLLLFGMFLAGVLVRYGAWPLLSVLPVCLWCAGNRKQQGAGRWLVPFLGLLLFVAGVLRADGELRFRAAYLPEFMDGQEVRLAGTVLRVEEKPRCVYYYLTDCVLERSNGHLPCNDVLAYASTGEYSIGQILVVRGTISLFDTARNEGGFDARSHYRSQKIDFGVWVDEARPAGETKSRFRAFLAQLRGRLAQSAAACGDADGILSAMLLGEKADLDAEVKSLYQRAGISHILAISGLHVSLLGIGLYRLLRRLGCSYAAASAVTAPFMFSYCVMTGGSVSTVRAVGMLFVCLIADLLGRGYDMLSALGLLGIVLLWENPFLVGYSGFVFSMTAVLGVGVAAPVLTAWSGSLRPEGDGDEERGQGIREAFLASLGIQLTTLPLVAFYYYELPSYAILLNLLVLMLVKYVAALGALAAAVGMVSVRLGRLLMLPCGWILALYEHACRGTLALPGAVITAGCPGRARIFAYYALLAAVLFVMHRRTLCRRAENERMMGAGETCRERPGLLRASAVRACVLGLTVLALVSVFAVHLRACAELDILDVGQGDGIYLCTSDGTRVFIDGGSSDVSGVGTYRILPFLKYRGVGQIDYWFVSHSDADHVNGLKEVLESGYPVKNLILSRAARGEEKTKALAELAASCGTQVSYMQAQDALVAQDARLTCIYPAQDAASPDVNALSLVLVLEDLGFRGIFTGDIPAEAERALLADNAVGRVDVYKAAHHGSKHSNCYEFLQKLSPSAAVVSCGADNRYGHPGEEALLHMREAGARIYQTTESGQIKIRYGRKGYAVHTFLEGS